MIETGTILQERYLVEKQIGAGGMGAVYLAVDQRFGSYVAIKETFYKDKELSDAFEREAHLLNSLHHPVLPHVSDYFTESGGYFLVMQFIEGEDLFEVLKREGAFPVKDVLRWTDSLLDALDYLHSQVPPIIHRDIKPQNLKITPRGDVILLDFGLAKLTSEDATGMKSVFGYSRKYSPLEQIQGTGTDARSDIFSLAATAYHLLTGEPPIDVLARAAEIVVGNPDPLKPAGEINNKIPDGVANVLNSALSLNSAGRFVSAKAMRQALEHAVSLDASENIEELPEKAATIVANDGIIHSVETGNFPALEAFAASTVNDLPPNVEVEKFIPAEIPISKVRNPLPLPEFTQATSVIDMPTQVVSRPKKARLPLAALVVLLVTVTLAAGYFINKANSSSKQSQTPTVQTVSEPTSNSEQLTTISDMSTTEVADSPPVENVESTKTKPRSSEKKVEKREVAGERKTADNPPSQAETIEKSKPISARAETSQPTPVRNTRPSQSQGSGETRSRVIESSPAPDIESIFTGRQSGQRDERIKGQPERRKQREQMSDEELQEMRRRRQQRRQRQNNPPFPF